MWSGSAWLCTRMTVWRGRSEMFPPWNGESYVKTTGIGHQHVRNKTNGVECSRWYAKLLRDWNFQSWFSFHSDPGRWFNLSVFLKHFSALKGCSGGFTIAISSRPGNQPFHNNALVLCKGPRLMANNQVLVERGIDANYFVFLPRWLAVFLPRVSGESRRTSRPSGSTFSSLPWSFVTAVMRPLAPWGPSCHVAGGHCWLTNN